MCVNTNSNETKDKKKLTVYYFSGTGNSKKVAVWISQVATELCFQTQLINVTLENCIKLAHPAADLLLFISPVHGFNYPPIMLSFIKNFPKGSNNVLLLNTRAGMLLNKWITPGLSGITFYLAAFILKTKGYHIKVMYPVDMPSNWISVHPGLNARTVNYILQQKKQEVTNFAHKTLIGGCSFKALYEIIQDMAVAPISVGYYFVGRFLFAKSYFASDDCNNCQACIKQCPVKAIVNVEGRPYWTYSCESCMRCMSNCHKKAIETTHGSIIVYSLLFSSFFELLFSKYFSQYLFPIENMWGKSIVESILFVALLSVWYRITHYLLRYRWFERMVVYTSLTKYKFWGTRYKAPNE